MQGTIKWFNKTKGYGFIGRENEPDVFITIRGLWETDIERCKKGISSILRLFRERRERRLVNVVKIPSAK